jgi:hypothetical protein
MTPWSPSSATRPQSPARIRAAANLDAFLVDVSAAGGRLSGDAVRIPAGRDAYIGWRLAMVYEPGEFGAGFKSVWINKGPAQRSAAQGFVYVRRVGLEPTTRGLGTLLFMSANVKNYRPMPNYATSPGVRNFQTPADADG